LPIHVDAAYVSYPTTSAGSALYTVVLNRNEVPPSHRAYVERRTKEGLSKREIMRCLKRYVARELFPLIIDALPPTDPTASTPRTLRTP
jgi:transposase